MDQEEALVEIDRLTKEYIERSEVAQRASREAAGLKKIIRAYMDMFPELEDERGALVSEMLTEGDDTPRGVEAVRKILHANPQERLYVSHLVEQLKARGWLPDSENPANAVRTTLERLVASPDSDVYKVRVGNNVAYEYDPDRAPPLQSRPPVSAEYQYEEEPF